MLRLNYLASCMALCAGTLTTTVAAETTQSLNSRMSLGLSDKGELTVNSQYLTYYMLRGRDPVSNNNADTPIFIKPVDGRLDAPSVELNWADGDQWYPSVSGSWPKFRSTSQAIDLNSMRYQGTKRDWKNTELMITGASIKDLFGKNSTFVEGNRTDTISLIGLNTVRLVSISGATITSAANLDTDKSLTTIQKVAEAFRDAKEVAENLAVYITYAQIVLDYIQGLQTALGSDAAAIAPYTQSFDVLKDNMDFFTDNISDAVKPEDRKKQQQTQQQLLLQSLSISFPEEAKDALTKPEYSAALAEVQKKLAEKYKAADPEQKELLIAKMTLETWSKLLVLVENDLKGRIKAEEDATKKASLENQLKWLKRGKGAVNLLVFYISNKDKIDELINEPAKVTPMLSEVGKMFVQELATGPAGEIGLDGLLDSQLLGLQEATLNATKKTANKIPFMKAINLGTQSGNVLIPFLWDAVLAESRLSTEITAGQFNPFGSLKSAVYVTRTSAKTGAVSTFVFTSDQLGQPMNVPAELGDKIKVQVALQRPKQFSPDRAPWLLNLGFAPQTVYESRVSFGGEGTQNTRLCARRISGNLDYSVHHLTVVNFNSLLGISGCGAGDWFANDWFSNQPVTIPSGGVAQVQLYNNPDDLPPKYLLTGEPTQNNVIQSYERTIGSLYPTLQVQANTYGSGFTHLYNITLAPARAVTVTPSKTDITLGESVAIKVEAAWDGVTSVVLKIGDKILEIFENLGDAINYVFEQLGNLTITADVRDANNNVLGSGASTVSVKAIALGSINPNEVIRTQVQQFKVMGERLPSNMRVQASGGICSNPMDVTSTSFTLNCDFDVVGDQTITVFNADTNQVAGSVVVKVKSNVTAVKWGINNGTVRFGDTITYTVEGVNLTGGMGFAVERCGVSNTEVGTGTDTQRTFQCFFNPDDGAFAGQMAGVVKDKPDGQVLFNFTVPVEVAPAKGSSLLTATGITTCGKEEGNGWPCTPEALGALYGLGQDGEVQAGKKMSYTVLSRNGAECVQDNVTGLIWEQKTDDGGLRDKDWTYTWYNPNSATNGGYAGTANGGSCFNKAGGAQCDTAGYVAALNATNYCGYSDWRMPTRMELTNLVDFSRINPSINPLFSNTVGSELISRYWSASPSADDDSQAWFVAFYYGYSSARNKDFKHHVRAARAGHEQR